MTRRFFIGGAAAFGAFGGLRFKAEASCVPHARPELVFGVVSESSSSDIVVRAFRKNGEVWLVVANSTRAEASAAVGAAGVKYDTLTLPALGAMVIKVK